MRPGTVATAEGDLGHTPLAHLLVYAVERRLTGALFLTDPRGATHVVRLVRGTPVKVRPGDNHALLGELLVERRAISPQTLEGALLAKGRLGEVLMLSGSIGAQLLEQVLVEQFRRRMVRLFALPPETIYRYYDGHFELVDWGAEPSSIDALAVIWAGLRAHADASSMMPGAIARLGDAPMRFHPNAPLARFQFNAEDCDVLELLQANPLSLPELMSYEAAPEEILRPMVYLLLITRQFDIGMGTAPVGYEERLSQPASIPGFNVGRLQLKSEAHRSGAAAPDPPGDGERAAVVARRRTKNRTSRPADVEGGPPSNPAQSASLHEVRPMSSAPAVEPSLIETSSGLRNPLKDRSAAGDEPVTVRSGRRASVRPQPAVGRAISELGTAPPNVVTSGFREPESETRPKTIDSSLAPSTLLEMAEVRLKEHDIEGACQCWLFARRVDPGKPDVIALGVWIRSMQSGADIKHLTSELDALLHDGAPLVKARFVRGLLRKRLSDEAGAMRDLRCVLELDPGHTDAAREIAALEALEARQTKQDGGLQPRFIKR